MWDYVVNTNFKNIIYKADLSSLDDSSWKSDCFASRAPDVACRDPALRESNI